MRFRQKQTSPARHMASHLPYKGEAVFLRLPLVGELSAYAD